LRLERGLRWLVHAGLAVLFASGVAWWALDDAPGSARPYLIATHGLAAMVFLATFGAVLALHVGASWQRGRNRVSGIAMLVLLGTLMATAFGLYYSGSDSFREILADIHLGAGLVLAPIVAVHIWLGAQGRRQQESRVRVEEEVRERVRQR
jgi:hypothetical protein